MKKRISISVEKGLVSWIDSITSNRSGFIQSLIEGARAGFKTLLVPEGMKLLSEIPPAPPPPPSASEAEKREWEEKYRKSMEKRKRKFALTPEQIAFQGAQEGITNQLNKLFSQHKITADMASSDITAMRKEMFELLRADKQGEE